MKSHKPHSFKVLIPSTPLWKIRAIARYKVRQNIKKRGHSMITGEPCGDIFPRPNKKLKLEDMNRGILEIAHEMNYLNTVRRLLLWLLKKSTLYETNLNHA
mmetsp:Transcript_7073/g.10571  ORF Transcript_7073/g.10571 Transcript_7073/m.10571 type:complete len:101 (-) Transcript_7073:145-447(-)